MQEKIDWSDGSAEISSVNYQTIREFNVQATLGNEPTEDVPSGSAWSPATSAYFGNFSSVGTILQSTCMPI